MNLYIIFDFFHLERNFCVKTCRRLQEFFSFSLQFPRVRDTSFTGVTVEECRLLLSGMDSHVLSILGYLINNVVMRPRELAVT